MTACATLQEFITQFNQKNTVNIFSKIILKNNDLQDEILNYLLEEEKKGNIDTYGWIYNQLAAIFFSKEDENKYLYYIAKGIELNNTLCLFNMGLYYYKKGNHIAHRTLALQFFERSARLSNLTAMEMLGSMYKNENNIKSYYWYKQAWLLGSETAKNILENNVVFVQMMTEEMRKKSKLEKLDIGSLIYDNIKRYY